jgi:flagellar motility protein MotE (MotC chaperone)
MTEPPTPPATPRQKDPFFKSLAVLKDLLHKRQDHARDVGLRPSLSSSSSARKVSTRRSSILLDQERTKRLREAEAAAANERSARLSLEKAFEDLTANRALLRKQLDGAVEAKKPLEEQIRSLEEAAEGREKQWAEERKQFEAVQAATEERVTKALQEVSQEEAAKLSAQRLVEELQERIKSQAVAADEDGKRRDEQLQSLRDRQQNLQTALETAHAEKRQLAEQVRVDAK